MSLTSCPALLHVFSGSLARVVSLAGRGEPHAQRTPAIGNHRLWPLPTLQTEGVYQQGVAFGKLLYLSVMKDVTVPVPMAAAVMQ